ncbi:hypothetical protein A2165_00420 [Candidatus Curtissbacteria bacterium RBG_13_40_7]|uniref:Nudix hydrolase domain-containing protein n=1 Tax=Candidatus Curtissbacteria bacterium RBG_13_40_7 TaxID=1797706 RepID=A0A1F5FVY3_9BACT|nr:MAG: hypothetical protein A2165_00420 [Candidatus Curtissbacteria bacterium RBG_13_40_7]
MIKCTFENGGKGLLRHVIVDALILNSKNEILLVKRAEGKVLEGGKWAIVGGFVERDETLEQTVHREVLEETGWEIDNIRLLRIIDNPNRPNEDRQNIAFVYVCEAVKKIGEADDESTEQRWFSFKDLPPKDNFAFDHFEDIEFYLQKGK